jgi:dipeptidyl aminopeptidase/acylaminoacyl peptidase
VVQQWGTTDEPALAKVFARGTLWEHPDEYRKFSPIWHFDCVDIPAIIHVCAGDSRCPPGNSKLAYRALKQTLSKTTELLTYPDGDHGLLAYKSRKAKLTWDLAWFDHYLRGQPIPKLQEALTPAPSNSNPEDHRPASHRNFRTGPG